MVGYGISRIFDGVGNSYLLETPGHNEKPTQSPLSSKSWRKIFQVRGPALSDSILRLLGAALLVFFLSGNFLTTIDLIEVGRGDYTGAIRYMAEETHGSNIVVGSDHDFRNKMVLSYYSKRLRTGKKLLYLDLESWPASGPEWIILHSLERNFQPMEAIYFKDGLGYSLARYFPCCGLSGFHWALYHKN
jgi:hypothetical protein